MDVVCDSFGIELKLADRETIRKWNCRNGVAILQEVEKQQEAEKQDDWIWMIDHSLQLGKLFVLVVLGVRRGDVVT